MILRESTPRRMHSVAGGYDQNHEKGACGDFGAVALSLHQYFGEGEVFGGGDFDVGSLARNISDF